MTSVFVLTIALVLTVSLTNAAPTDLNDFDLGK